MQIWEMQILQFRQSTCAPETLILIFPLCFLSSPKVEVCKSKFVPISSVIFVHLPPTFNVLTTAILMPCNSGPNLHLSPNTQSLEPSDPVGHLRCVLACGPVHQTCTLGKPLTYGHKCTGCHHNPIHICKVSCAQHISKCEVRFCLVHRNDHEYNRHQKDNLYGDSGRCTS